MGMVPQSVGCSTPWSQPHQDTPLEGYRSGLRDSIQRLVHEEGMPASHPDVALMLTHLTKRQAHLEVEAVWSVLQTAAPHLSEETKAELRRKLIEATYVGCDVRYS